MNGASLHLRCVEIENIKDGQKISKINKNLSGRHVGFDCKVIIRCSSTRVDKVIVNVHQFNDLRCDEQKKNRDDPFHPYI